MTQQPIGVCVIVLDNTKKSVLLGRRINAYKSGMFGLPGGRVNLSEPLAKCARRELFEEAGLQVKSLKYIGVVRELQNTYNFIHFVYLCEKFEGKLETKEPHKCEKWEWYSLDALPKDILPGHKAALDLFKGVGTHIKELLQ